MCCRIISCRCMVSALKRFCKTPWTRQQKWLLKTVGCQPCLYEAPSKEVDSISANIPQRDCLHWVVQLVRRILTWTVITPRLHESRRHHLREEENKRHCISECRRTMTSMSGQKSPPQKTDGTRSCWFRLCPHTSWRLGNLKSTQCSQPKDSRDSLVLKRNLRLRAHIGVAVLGPNAVLLVTSVLPRSSHRFKLVWRYSRM